VPAGHVGPAHAGPTGCEAPIPLTEQRAPWLPAPCRACDRPLDTLDVAPGPHLPTHGLPARPPPAGELGARAPRSGRANGEHVSPQPSTTRLQPNTDPNVRAVQQW
jgi:hypothetical protein